MNIIVLENDKCLEPYITKFKDVPNSSRLYITPNNFNNASSKLKTPPILTHKWLVIISSRLSESQLLGICSDSENINIIETETKLKFNDVKNIFLTNDIEFKVFDNTKTSKTDCILYVQTKLKLDEADRKYLCKRHGYYFPKIVESVHILSGMDNIDRKVIRQYTEARSIYISQITDTLLGVKNLNKASVDLIYEYRYGFKFLLSVILNDLALYEFIFTEISSGFLDLTNYREYKTDNELFNNASLYRKETIINTYRSLSFDKLLYVKTKVEMIEPKSSNIYKLIKLLY